MKTFEIWVNVMPLEGLLDPRGKAVSLGIQRLGIEGVSDVRIGKRIRLQIQAASKDEAYEKAKLATEKLLHNPIIEQFQIEEPYECMESTIERRGA